MLHSPPIPITQITTNVFEIPSQRQLTTLALFLQSRQKLREAERAQKEASDLLIVEYLAGRLDTTGHHVEVREKAVGYEIIKFLIIDGEG